MKNKNKKTPLTGNTQEAGISIPCEWVMIESTRFNSEDRNHKTRCGRYHQSTFPSVPEYGVRRWVVCGYLKIKEPDNVKDLTENEIVEGCAAFLNQPPPRKRKSIYGSLKPVWARWRGRGKYEVKFTPEHMIVMFSTDQRKNKNFWSDGINTRVKTDGRKTRHKS